MLRVLRVFVMNSHSLVFGSRVRTPFGESAAWKLDLRIFDPAGRPQGRNVAIWMSDDTRRLPMKVQGELPVGTFDLELRDVK